MMDESQTAALTNGSGRDKVKNSGTERPREEGECHDVVFVYQAGGFQR
jgi:hypothetical protein